MYILDKILSGSHNIKLTRAVMASFMSTGHKPESFWERVYQLR